MRVLKIIIGFVCSSIFFGCDNRQPPKRENITPPLAKKEEKLFEEYKQRIDNFYWLSDPLRSEVLPLIDAENAYSNNILAHTEGVQQALFEEIRQRSEHKKEELPVKRNGYWQYNRYESEEPFPLICRKKDTWSGKEEVILDVPKLAKMYPHFDLADVVVSPDNNFVAYLVDLIGDSRYSLYIKNIATGVVLPEIVPNVGSGSLVWMNDGKTLLYVLVDNTVRGYKAMKHKLGTAIKNDLLLYEEKDKSSVLYLTKSHSQQYIFLGSYGHTSTEIRFLNANNLADSPHLIQSRQSNLLYYLDHYEGDEFVIQNNHHAPNFKLSSTTIQQPRLDAWKDFIPHSDSSMLENFEVLKDYVVVQSKANGLSKIRIFNRLERTWREIKLGDEAYVADMSLPDFDNYNLDSIRFNYQSLSTPRSTFSYNLKTHLRIILQQDKVSNFNSSKYESKQIWVKARDSVQIPLSIVYQKDLFLKNGTNPLLLYAFGAYGYSTDSRFQPEILSLLDRGFVYCIAHVRGGQELGAKWHQDGKLLKKKNSFNDYLDCADYLVKNKFTSTNHLFGLGEGAGAMLVAAAINMRPNLFKGVVTELPWTDVVTDMLNDSLPLTALEYVEWGDPKQKKYYDYMLSWSPYDNVKRADYPAVFAFSNLNDSKVPYYSGLKWVQKLRLNSISKNPILFYCDKQSRVGSKTTGRLFQYELLAKQYAFMLDLLNQ